MQQGKAGVLSALVCSLLIAVALPAFGLEPPKEDASNVKGEAARTAAPDQEARFEITGYQVVGNTLLPEQQLSDLLDDFTGPDCVVADVEKAREALESRYHDAGYPTVLVNIPEQSITVGTIRLQVIESKTGTTTVTGNRHYDSRMILKRLPALAPGTVLYLPAVQEQVGKLNRIPDLKVVPALAPGKEQATVDIALKAEDHFPLHGSLEINNRYSANTTALRLNGALHYDNLWQAEHALSLQYQTAPEKPEEVQVISGSYSLPAPWLSDQTLVLYGVDSDSATGFGAGFQTKGKGIIIGTRLIAPLPGRGEYTHGLVLGLDYKKFQESVGQNGADVTTPVEYLPASLVYNGSLADSGGLTSVNGGLNASFRGLVARESQFSDKRYKSRGNYLTATLGGERRQTLPAGLGLKVKVDGQIANQPLISNEQYSAGGMESVRGYLESALSADSALHGSFELSLPDALQRLGKGEHSAVPYLFYDAAALWTLEPLPGQQDYTGIHGAGFGLRGLLYRNFDYQGDCSWALSREAAASPGDFRFYFKVKYQF